MKNIHLILVGMMGSGKTSTAEHLSQKLNRKHIDLDNYISKLYEKSIEEIINQHTLENFRILEEQCFNKLLETNLSPMVISLGGGTFTHKNNFGKACDHTIYFLKCSPQTLVKRLNIAAELNKRPLLKGLEANRLQATLEKLLLARQALYDQADHTIECDHLSLEDIVQKIGAHL